MSANKTIKTDAIDSASLAHGFAILCASAAPLLHRLWRCYALMKPLLTTLIIFLASCSTISGDKKIIGYWKDGACENELEHLHVTRFIENDEKLKEMLDEEAFSKEHAEGLYRKLVETKLNSGGRYAEISSTRRAWKSLYGAWGFGVVKNHCIVEFSPFVVS